MTPTPVSLLVKIFLPFAAGYFLSYLFRVVNAVISVDLVRDIGVDPSELGLLTATYFITFASFQLPLGVLLDRFGPRKTESLLLLFAAAGAYLFSQATTLTGLILGRALIGFGVSACLMAAFKAYTMWFPRQRWVMINGFQMASGGLGALAATSPVEYMIEVSDWRMLFILLSLATLGVALLVFFMVPESQTVKKGESLKEQIAGIKQVFTSLIFWRAAPLTTMSQTAFLSIQGLWAGPWLRDVVGLERAASASVLSQVAIAMICGFILLGTVTERLDKIGVPVIHSAVGGMSLFLLVQLISLIGPLDYYLPVWLAFGFFGTSGIISYAALSRSFPVELSGRVTTAINLLVFVSAFFVQWLIGAIIELWPVQSSGAYSEQGFRAAFGLVLAVQVLSLIWYLAANRLVKVRKKTADN